MISQCVYIKKKTISNFEPQIEELKLQLHDIKSTQGRINEQVISCEQQLRQIPK